MNNFNELLNAVLVTLLAPFFWSIISFMAGKERKGPYFTFTVALSDQKIIAFLCKSALFKLLLGLKYWLILFAIHAGCFFYGIAQLFNFSRYLSVFNSKTMWELKIINPISCNTD